MVSGSSQTDDTEASTAVSRVTDEYTTTVRLEALKGVWTALVDDRLYLL
jgi:hypothetical protein